VSSSVRKLSLIDSAFLFAETVECPMHVGSVTILRLPEGYSGDFYEDVKRRFASRLHVAKSLRYKLAPAPFDIDRPSWVEDEQFDIDRHVYRAAIPAPADRDTLLRVSGWMHAKPLNRARPLWEIYVYDNLPNNEAAIYTKIHHALIDGGAGAALTEILYDGSPTAPVAEPPPLPEGNAERHEVRDFGVSLVAAYAELMRAPGSRRNRLAFEFPRSGRSDLASVLLDAAIHQIEWPLRLAGSAPDIATAFSTAFRNAVKPGAGNAASSMVAPSTPFNVTVSSERSFAGVSLPLARVKAVGAKAGGKVNDVVLALSAAILRRFLLELDALPRATLTSFVPISAREAGDAEMKNQVFGMVVPLATDVADPKVRLETIVTESQRAKDLANPFRALVPHLAEMPTFGMPMMLQLLSTFYSRSNLANVVPPQFNVVISNVFIGKRPLYIAGAELQHIYPMSIVVHGQGLNITVQGYRDHLDFGLIAGANVVPNVAHIAAMLPDALDELERAYGIAPPPAVALASAAPPADAPPVAVRAAPQRKSLRKPPVEAPGAPAQAAQAAQPARRQRPRRGATRKPATEPATGANESGQDPRNGLP
jgi:WS/DGAT/MGAT family acyltransferase